MARLRLSRKPSANDGTPPSLQLATSLPIGAEVQQIHLHGFCSDKTMTLDNLQGFGNQDADDEASSETVAASTPTDSLSGSITPAFAEAKFADSALAKRRAEHRFREDSLHDAYYITNNSIKTCGQCQMTGKAEVFMCRLVHCDAVICSDCIDSLIEGKPEDAPLGWLGSYHDILKPAYMDRKATGNDADYSGYGVRMMSQMGMKRRSEANKHASNKRAANNPRNDDARDFQPSNKRVAAAPYNANATGFCTRTRSSAVANSNTKAPMQQATASGAPVPIPNPNDPFTGPGPIPMPLPDPNDPDRPVPILMIHPWQGAVLMYPDTNTFIRVNLATPMQDIRNAVLDQIMAHQDAGETPNGPIPAPRVANALPTLYYEAINDFNAQGGVATAARPAPKQGQMWDALVEVAGAASTAEEEGG